jgi:tripartite-type tricarboxylate transporter receptor subunit TctC
VACSTAWAAVLTSRYPQRPIRIVVGFPPGGTADVLARAIARELTESWGQPVVIDNRPGAGSMIASELVAKAAPDGYTLLVVTSSHAVSASAARNAMYDPVKSFTPVTTIAATPLGLIGHPGAPVKNLRDLITYAKANPGKLNYGSSGAGSTTHLAGEMLAAMAGIRLTHVPYRGGAPSMNELLGGQIQLLMISWPSAMPQIIAGKVTGLGISSTQRSSAVPEVPTIAEGGVTGYEALQWYAALAPAGLPPPMTQQLNTELRRIVHMPKVADFITNLGADVRTSSVAEFDVYLRAETVKWGRLIERFNLEARK